MRRTAAGVLALLVLWLGLGRAASAQDAFAVQVHGFGGWAAGYTSNDNNFAYVASSDWALSNYYFALNVAAQPSDRVSVHAQAFWGENLNGRKVELDYVFAQYTVRPELSVRLGKVKSPFGLYTEIFDVGTLRPFYLLPQAVYGAPGIVSKSYLGVGLTGDIHLGKGWDISYDAFGGELQLQEYMADFFAIDPITGGPVLSPDGSLVFQPTSFSPVGHDLYGGKLSLNSAPRGVDIGLSFEAMQYETIIGGRSFSEAPYRLLGGHASWITDRVSLKGEAFRMTSSQESAPGIDGYYLEAAYKLAGKWQVAATYDHRRRDRSSTVGSVDKHDALGFALNLWLAPDVVLKLSYYRVEGNTFARPPAYLAAASEGTLPEEKTDVFIAGMQFSF